MAIFNSYFDITRGYPQIIPVIFGYKKINSELWGSHWSSQGLLKAFLPGKALSQATCSRHFGWSGHGSPKNWYKLDMESWNGEKCQSFLRHINQQGLCGFSHRSFSHPIWTTDPQICLFRPNNDLPILSRRLKWPSNSPSLNGTIMESRSILLLGI